MQDKFLFDLDVYRKLGTRRLSFKDWFINHDLRCLKIYRKAHYYYINGKKIRFLLQEARLIYLSSKFAFNISSKATIGKGLFIGHNGPITINGKAVIGNNCNISVGVTIGIENRGKRVGAPVIGNGLWIGTNAVIVGKIHIGSNVLITPNSFVNFDVPSNSIVIGNPGIIKPCNNATDFYVVNKV